jgi:hypothetical protein
MQATAAQPLDLDLLVDRLCMTCDEDTPACSGLLVKVISLERGDVLLLRGRQLRSSSGKEDRVRKQGPKSLAAWSSGMGVSELPRRPSWALGPPSWGRSALLGSHGRAGCSGQ